MPPVVLRKRLWRELCSHPRLERYVRRSGKFRPINSVGVGIVGVQPVEVAIREEWATSAAMYNKSAQKIAQGNLSEVRIAQNKKTQGLTTSSARPILQRRRVTEVLRLGCLLKASIAIAMRE